MVDISTAGIVPVPKRSALETLRRELSQNVSFEQSIALGKPPQGGMIVGLLPFGTVGASMQCPSCHTMLPCTTVHITPPWGVFWKLDCSTTKRVPIPNGTSSEALGERFPTPTLVAPALFQLWRYQPWQNRPRGVWYTPSYASTEPCTCAALKVLTLLER